MKRPLSAFLATHRSIVLALGVFFGLAVFGVITWSVSAGNRAKSPEKILEQEPAAAQTGKEKKAGTSLISDDPSMIMLNAGAIDTAKVPSKVARLAAKSGGKQMGLVKFSGPIQPDWYASMEKAGVEIIDYIPNYSYLVYGDPQSLARVGDSVRKPESGVSWYGDYTSAMRIDPSVYSAARSKDSAEAQFYKVQLYKDDATNTATLNAIESIQTAKPKKEAFSYLHYVVTTVGLTVEGVEELSRRPDVISIYPYTEAVKLDERQDMIMAGNLTGNLPTPGDYLSYLAGKGFTQAQFTASGFAVNLTDSGIDNGTQTPNHFLLYKLGDPTLPANSRIIYNRLQGTPNAGSTISGCDGHGNENAGIICGYVPTGGIYAAAPHADAAGFRYGLGIAPFVKVGSSVIFDPGTFTNPTYQNLESQAYRDGARISSNSWGANNNAYTIDSQQYDALVRDAQPDTGCALPNCISAVGNQEYIIAFAAGNAGSGGNTVGEPGTAKNVITVGASENVQAFGAADGCGTGDTGADSANDIIGFSSRGPTSDGRKKPDIVGPGTHVSSGVAQTSIVSPVGSGTGSQLACFDGTGVCGGTGGSNFFPTGQQWYTASSGTSHSTPAIAGEAALIRQYFINNALPVPSPAMTKALMLNSARYLTGAGANDALPSNSQGMGEMNLNSFFDIFATAHSIHDQVGAETFTATGQQRIITGTISDTGKPLRLTLVWTDAPGATTGNAFVNNLDLEVTAGGNVYNGNVFNTTGGFSTTGGTADTRNNVESVFIPAGVSGNIVIKVKATNIAGNGVPNNAQPLDQDFALVGYNVTEGALPVIGGGATAITAESCAPANSAIDPGETVTVNFDFANVGTANTTNLVATLQPGGGVTAPSGPQTYGALVAGGPAVTRPFTFTANTTCGQTINAVFQLQDGASNLGTITFNLQTGALGPPAPVGYSTGNIAVPIVDVGSVDIPITVAQTGAVADMNVKVRLNHTFDHDVVLTLIAPDGTPVVLSASHDTTAGGGDNYGTGTNDCSGTPTIFDDAAATTIGSSVPPFAGTFRPDEALSAFNGKSLSGIWKLRVQDIEALDTGTVGCVSLDVQRRAYACCGVAGTPIPQSGGPDVIVGESMLPHNNAPDPGERITITVPVVNAGDGPTSNLTATLQNTGGVTLATAPQNYGAVPTGGAPVSRTFAFTASGACGGNITLSFQLQDGATNYGTITFTRQLGTTSSSTTTFTNATPIVIPASGTGATTGAPATPYSSDIAVAGITAPVTNVTVALNGISHTFPSDVDVLLVGPTGVKFILMSDVIGGTDWTGQTYTFDDTAAALVPASGTPPATGSFKPTDYGTGDVFPAPAPAGPYLDPATAGAATLASAFNGVNPNGTWSLFVVDDAGTDVGTFAGGWTLSITSSTPVCATALAAGVDVSGRVATSDGRGVTNAVVSITDSEGGVRTAVTGRNGLFTFTDVEAGQTYIVNVASRRFRFEPKVLQINDNVSGVLFIPME